MTESPPRPTRLPFLAGGAALVIGSAITLGWILGVTDAIQPVPRFSSMKFNTALCFVCLGAALLLLARRRLTAVAACLAGLASVVAAASLFQWVTGVDLGIDQLVVDDIGPALAHPGRMAPEVTVVMLMLGAGILAEARQVSWLAHLLAMGAAFVAFGATVVYLFGALEVHGLGNTEPIAPLSAALQLGLAAGTLFLRMDETVLAVVYGDSLGGQVARRLLPVAIATPVIAGWAFLQGERLGWYDASLGLALVVMTTLTLLSVTVWITARLIGSLDTRRQQAETAVVRVSELAKHQAQALADSDALRGRQRLEALGQLAGSVAHDVNNMMTVVSGYSAVLLKEIPRSSAWRTQVEEILKAADRCSAMTRHLLAFGRQQVLKPVVLDLGERVAELADMLPMLVGDDVAVASRRQPDLWHVLADPAQIDQVLVNLAVNARDAMPAGGTFEIDTSNVEFTSQQPRPVGLEPGRYVKLTVRDSGVGMDAATLARAFEPFFTTKAAGAGTGLGLSTVYGIVRQSRGLIEAESAVGSGTTFRIYLPVVDAPVTATLPEVEASSGTETILVAEDDDGVRDLITVILRRAGYTVLEASDGSRATFVSRTHDGPIHLLVSDVIMPGQNGVELARALALTHPSTRILLISGSARSATDLPHAAFLHKPFTPEALLRSVRHVLDRPHPA